MVPCCVFPRLHLHRRTTVALNQAANIGDIGDTTGDIGNIGHVDNVGNKRNGGEGIGSMRQGESTRVGVIWGLEEGERRVEGRGEEAALELASVADGGVGVAGGEVAGREGVVGEWEEGDLVVTYEDFIGEFFFVGDLKHGVLHSLPHAFWI